jgi:hypothetical protein
MPEAPTKTSVSELLKLARDNNGPTVAQMAQFVGCSVEAKFDPNFWFKCNVKDVRVSWGKINLLVSPEAGSGEAWLSVDRVRQNADKPWG